MINRRKFVSSLLGIFSTPAVSLVKPTSTAVETVVETDEGMMEQIASEMRLGMALQAEGIDPNPAISSMRQLGGVVQQVENILSKLPTVPVEEETNNGDGAIDYGPYIKWRRSVYKQGLLEVNGDKELYWKNQKRLGDRTLKLLKDAHKAKVEDLNPSLSHDPTSSTKLQNFSNQDLSMSKRLRAPNSLEELSSNSPLAGPECRKRKGR